MSYYHVRTNGIKTSKTLKRHTHNIYVMCMSTPLMRWSWSWIYTVSQKNI